MAGGEGVEGEDGSVALCNLFSLFGNFLMQFHICMKTARIVRGSFIGFYPDPIDIYLSSRLLLFSL